MLPREQSLQDAIHKSKTALKSGDKKLARRWAERALQINPNHEETWLILAAIATPRASIFYLQKALDINPQSKRARRGMHWAIQRYRKSQSKAEPPHQLKIPAKISAKAIARRRQSPVYWLALCVFLVLIAGYFINWEGILNASAQEPLKLSQVDIHKDTRTPTPTLTFTPTPTFTPTSTPSPTPTATPTSSPTSTATNTLVPSLTPNRKNGPAARPAEVGANERWIDVDLSSQHTYALEGDVLLKSFLVSTGTWQHPTVKGVFRIYVKYRYAHMSGPGYFLPNVPYVMYFYKGYGLHGTYWHNNFGTPMSHGCVNLRTEDAKWLFNWASVGTVVNVHK